MRSRTINESIWKKSPKYTNPLFGDTEYIKHDGTFWFRVERETYSLWSKALISTRIVYIRTGALNTFNPVK